MKDKLSASALDVAVGLKSLDAELFNIDAITLH